MVNKFDYVLYNKGQYYKITDVDIFVDLDVEDLQITYETLYIHIMHQELLKRFVEENVMNKADTSQAKLSLVKVPMDNLLYTQEFIDKVLTEKMGEYEFLEFKKGIEERFILAVVKQFGQT